ncbi:MAG TPA: DUF5658 family protein [Syntrophales bacterium]|nr:hypothetical protein [Syntrophobacterales bacterium]HNQ01516.1 DUF5658 family protein [Syntrophales bacterium]HQL89456.1 DUF5658 family protein [Syntrophales bacterium]
MQERIGPDRRRRPTPMLSRYSLFRGRRKGFRRREDRDRGGYVDRYSPWLFGALMGLVLLNILDALFTRLILDWGGTELNPVAAWALAAFGDHFIVWKIAVIGLCATVLCLLSGFRAAKAAIALAVGLYGVVVCYQLVLMSSVL